MKKMYAVVACSVAILWAGSALASPIDVDIDAGNSSVGFTDYNEGITVWGWTFLDGSTLTVGLASGLDDVKVTGLGEGESTDWFDFLTFTATGTGVGSFDIAASMAFESPEVGSADATGDGGWGTASLFGKSVSGGALFWDDNTIDLLDSWGNAIVVTLEQGFTIQCGQTVNLQAMITNNGGGTAPVPEPATMLLFGTGMAGLVGSRLRRKK